MRIVLILLAVWIVYELAENTVLPLLFYWKQRKKKPECGVEALIGKVGEVQTWDLSSGFVFVNGERWRAVSDDAPAPRGRVVVRAVEGLTLRVAAVESAERGGPGSQGVERGSGMAGRG